MNRTSGTATTELSILVANRRWRADLASGADLSLPLRFDGPQPAFFGVEPANETALEAGSFIGDVRRGGSVNCSRYSLTPHCNGTHTECAGHITRDRLSVRTYAPRELVPAALLTVTPTPFALTSERSGEVSQPGDRLITRETLQAASKNAQAPIAGGAVIIRTLPNSDEKRTRNHDLIMPAYLSGEAAAWLIEHDTRHLIVDLPSIDRASDNGQLMAHRIFWGMPPGSTEARTAARIGSTITELAYIDDALADGLYLLNLQVAPFDADAAPSRPILYPLVAA